MKLNVKKLNSIVYILMDEGARISRLLLMQEVNNSKRRSSLLAVHSRELGLCVSSKIWKLAMIFHFD